MRSTTHQLRYPIFQENSSIQNGSISIGRSYSKIAFLGLRKGTPFEPQFCAQKWRNHNLGEEPENPSLLFRQGCPCVKDIVFVLIKGKSPCGNSMHPGDFGGQRAINMEHLAAYSFLSDEARRIWKPKT